jgi:prolyl-tRNA editing enzyme YbaK/EbsC (Cys-tRNA(Pro) deacylase)
MIPKALQKYLDKLELKPAALSHRTVYTAYDLAKTTKLKLQDIAKSMLIKVEPPFGDKKHKYLIAVVPASHQMDFKKLAKVLKVKKVSMAAESVMAKLYKVKPGAMTPFGPFHKKTPVIIDKALLKSKKIIARGGSFTESLVMSGKEFLKSTEGVVASFAQKAKKK